MNLIEIVKESAMQAYRATNPADIVYGTVVSDDPLEIQIDTKMILDESFLILTKNVSKSEIEVDIDFSGNGLIEIEELEQTLLKKMSIIGAKITIHNEIQTGDTVIMQKKQGGQEYVVLDKLEREGG